MKDYYKFRPRIGDTTTSYDRQTEEGIIADGYLSFSQEDGSRFLATVEATSFDTRHEVIFKKQERLLFWDAIAITALIGALLFAINHHYDWWTVNKVGQMLSFLILAGVLSILFSIVRFFIKNQRRYRYIYAVEQFKRYHADEQWVAIGDDVFDGAGDPRYQELKEQCVRNGFGLIGVDLKKEPQMTITPSRMEIFGRSRTKKNFLSRNEAENRSKTVRLKNWWNTSLSRLTGQRSDNPLLRYERRYWNQMLICTIGLSLITGIFIQEANTASIVYVDEKEYEQNAIKTANTEKPETARAIDTAFVEKNDKPVKPYLDGSLENVETNIDYGDIMIAVGDGTYMMYDCQRFFNYMGSTKYMLIEGIYYSREKSVERSQSLHAKGINANSLWMGCFDDEKDYYIVFLDFLFDDTKEAEILKKTYLRRFRKKDLSLEVKAVSL